MKLLLTFEELMYLVSSLKDSSWSGAISYTIKYHSISESGDPFYWVSVDEETAKLPGFLTEIFRAGKECGKDLTDEFTNFKNQ